MEAWEFTSDVEGGGAGLLLFLLFLKNKFCLLFAMTMAVVLFIVTTGVAKNILWFCVEPSEGRASFSPFRGLRKEAGLHGCVDGSGFGMSSMTV